VATDSEEEVIEIAYQTKCQDFALQRFRNMDLGEDFGYLEEIHQRLDQAYQVLMARHTRQDYDEDIFSGRETAEYESPFLAEKAYDTGESLAAEGRHEVAAQAYSQAAEIDHQPEYRAIEAWAVFKAHDCAPDVGEEMLDVVQESLEDAPGQYAIHMVAAWLHRALGHLDQSIQHYQAVIQINPGLRKAFDELEELLLGADQLVLLEEQYRRTIFLLDDGDPEYAADLWKRLTLLYARKLEDRQKAQTAANAVVKMKPEAAEELEEELEMEFELFPDVDDDGW
jgi:tetratricopeptide (TPR) repeat protein